MKILFIIVTLFLSVFIGCGLPVEQEKDGIDIVRIDGCQYLQNSTYLGYFVYTHKGDCDNPIHQRRLINE